MLKDQEKTILSCIGIKIENIERHFGSFVLIEGGDLLPFKYSNKEKGVFTRVYNRLYNADLKIDFAPNRYSHAIILSFSSWYLYKEDYKQRFRFVTDCNVEKHKMRKKLLLLLNETIQDIRISKDKIFISISSNDEKIKRYIFAIWMDEYADYEKEYSLISFYSYNKSCAIDNEFRFYDIGLNLYKSVKNDPDLFSS